MPPANGLGRGYIVEVLAMKHPPVFYGKKPKPADLATWWIPPPLRDPFELLA